MGKRILITSTDLMMIQFLVPHVINLAQNGFEVEIACSEVGGRLSEVQERLKAYVKKVHVVRLARSPLSPINRKGYQDMKQVIGQGHYDIIWTNEPVMGVVTRLAAKKARKNGTRVIYMVHGFHFFKGAPIVNWLLFYPIERFAAHFCDEIVTINWEDYTRANHFAVPSVKHIHGIGVNTDRLQRKENRNSIRQELQLSEDDFLVLSVGELNANKNHRVIINALSKLNHPKIHYVICGKGDQMENLQKLIEETNQTGRIHLLGYRRDVVDICSEADVFVHPSHREGLPLAVQEAMYCGLPLITSKIRGVVDVMVAGKTGFLCSSDDADTFAENIRKMKDSEELRKKMGAYNREAVKPYCLDNTMKEVQKIIDTIEIQ